MDCVCGALIFMLETLGAAPSKTELAPCKVTLAHNVVADASSTEFKDSA